MQKEKRKKFGVKVFNGDHFSVWLYHLKIAFQSKKVFNVVTGIEKRPAVTPGTRNNNELQEQIDAWDQKNADSCMLIRLGIFSRVYLKLASCSTAKNMWTKLCSIDLQRTAENVFQL